jgi:hypothetical protein
MHFGHTFEQQKIGLLPTTNCHHLTSHPPAMLRCLFTFFCACVCLSLACSGKKQVRYVAYVGFNTTNLDKAKERQYSDPINAAMLDEYLDRLSKKHPHTEYRRLTFDCDFDTKKIDSIYQIIEKNPDVALVIDNTWGKHILRARERIRVAGLPVISLTADQNRLDFGQNVLFLSPSDPQPFFQIRYIKHVLHASSVSMISEVDYRLHERYDSLLQANDIRSDVLIPLSQSAYDANNRVPDRERARFVAELDERLQACPDSVILLNLHTGYAEVLLDYLEQKPLRGKTIVGLQQAAQVSNERLQKLTRAGCTFITFEDENEAFSEPMHYDWLHFYPKYQAWMDGNRTPRNLLIRMHDAIAIFETAINAKQSDHRDSVAAFFRTLAARKLMANNELFEFDSSMILRKNLIFSQIRDGKLRTSPTQINANGDSMANLRVGLDIIDINEIDLRSNTFNCNLRYWVIADSQHIGKESFIHFNTLIRADDSQITPIAERTEDNYVIRIYQVSGKFFNNYETATFPLDWQEIKVPISALASSEEIKISFDDSRLRAQEKLPKFQFNDWSPEDFFVTLDNQIANRLGALERVDANESVQSLEKYKTFSVHLKVKRRFWGALTLIILPFLMFSMLPILLLFSNNISFDDIGETIMSTFIAAVAYSINLVQLSPTTDSLNRAYLFLLLTLGVNSVCLLFVVFIDKQNTRELYHQRVNWLKRVFPVALMGAFLVGFYYIFR